MKTEGSGGAQSIGGVRSSTSIFLLTMDEGEVMFTGLDGTSLVEPSGAKKFTPIVVETD